MEQKQGTVTAEVASKSNACGASQQSIVQETASHDSPFQLLQHMQVAAGNRATGRWLQAKLRVGAPDDVYERQADRVADQIMCMPQPGPRQEAEQQLPGPALQRECATCVRACARYRHTGIYGASLRPEFQPGEDPYG